MKLIDILFWVVLIIAVVIAVWALVGSSPTIEQLMITLMIVMFVGIYDLKVNTNKEFSGMRYVLKGVGDTLNRMESTLKDIEKNQRE